jgi:hypothetical protein
MRDLGAVTTYAHPVFAPGDDPEGDPDDLFRPFRMVEARELVADAALGLVDAVELVSCFDDRGALVLYHHLLSCGLRLTATAGTDTFPVVRPRPGPCVEPSGLGPDVRAARRRTAEHGGIRRRRPRRTDRRHQRALAHAGPRPRCRRPARTAPAVRPLRRRP